MEKDRTAQTPVVLGADRILDRWLKLWELYKYVILASLILGFAAHMFVFTNKLLNRDESVFLFGIGATVSSGRWGLEILSRLLPMYSMPWLWGIVTLGLLTWASCLIVSCLQIHSRVLQILVPGLLITFPSLTGTFGYMFTSSAYAISFLLACAAAGFACRRDWKGFLLAVLCGGFSAGIYQAYIVLTAGILMVRVIRQVLSSSRPIGDIFREGLFYLLVLAGAVIFYGIAAWLSLKLTGTVLNSYADGALHEDIGFFQKLFSVYPAFKHIITRNLYGLVAPGLVRDLHFLLLGLSVLSLAGWAFRSRQPGRILMLFLLLAAFPMAACGILLISAPMAVHTLALYSFCALYLLMAVIIDCGCLAELISGLGRKLHSLVLDGMILAMALILAGNISISNEAYLKQHLTYENTMSTVSTIMAQIQMTPGYTRDTPIAFLSAYDVPDFYENFENIRNITGINNLSFDSRVMEAFLRYYCGQQAVLVPQEERFSLLQLEEVANMPVYPDNGSIQLVDGTIVVNLLPEN